MQGVCFLAFFSFLWKYLLVMCSLMFLPCCDVSVTIYLRGAKVKLDLFVLVNDGVC